MPLRRAARFAPYCLLLAGGCLLTEPEASDPVAALRSQQEVQAERIADALCSGYYACGCDDRYPDHETETECVTEISAHVLARLERGIDRGLDYDPTCLDAYAEVLERLGCAVPGEVLLDAELSALLDTADRCHAYHGSLEVGEECTSVPSRGSDCGPALACDDFDTCVDDSRLAEGEPCNTDDPRCAPGLWCIQGPLTGGATCIQLPLVGEPCWDSGGTCGLDAWCDSTDFVCKPWARPGEACEAETCGFDAYCDAGTCVAAPVEGEPCEGRCALGSSCGDDGRCLRDRAFVCDMDERLP